MSLPVRERGLKFKKSLPISAGHKSLPVRERGLKSVCRRRRRADWHVAPRAGAWIEIPSSSQFGGAGLVAPRAGAWIEIPQRLRCTSGNVSLPVRERGLK